MATDRGEITNGPDQNEKSFRLESQTAGES